jgi:hypothetical protein
MNGKIYLYSIFGALYLIIGLFLYLNHEQKIGNFLILLAVSSEIRAVLMCYFNE